MRQLAIGLTMALLSSVAFAQTPAPQNGEKAASGSVNATGQTSTGAGRTGASERTERGAAAGAKSETNIRIGVESRGRDRDDTVRSRGDIRERTGVEVRRQRSVTSVSSVEPESRVVVRHGASKKKVVIRKKRHGQHYVLRSRRQVVEEPTVSVRRRSARRIETSEPSASIRSRTTIRDSREEGVRGGASIERRESGARSSSQTGVSATASGRETRGSGTRKSGASETSTPTTSGASSNGPASATSQPQR